MYGQTLADAMPLGSPLTFDEFLARLSPKDRINAEKHVTTCQAFADPRHASVWQQIACDLMSLAGHSAKLNRNPPTAQFYIADGRYRMQLFALENELEGQLSVYCGDELAQAVKDRIIVVRTDGDDIIGYFIPETGEPLAIERIDGATINPPAYVKDMVGWNRKALRISLSSSASPAQLAAVKSLCALSMPALKKAPAPVEV
jgi:hypothetical protein